MYHGLLIIRRQAEFLSDPTKCARVYLRYLFKKPEEILYAMYRFFIVELSLFVLYANFSLTDYYV